MHFDNFFQCGIILVIGVFLKTNNKRGNHEKYNRICRKRIKWR